MREPTSTIIPRETYLSKLRAARGLDVIKGLTGIRRCGKSTLLLAFMDEDTPMAQQARNYKQAVQAYRDRYGA